MFSAWDEFDNSYYIYVDDPELPYSHVAGNEYTYETAARLAQYMMPYGTSLAQSIYAVQNWKWPGGEAFTVGPCESNHRWGWVVCVYPREKDFLEDDGVLPYIHVLPLDTAHLPLQPLIPRPVTPTP